MTFMTEDFKRNLLDYLTGNLKKTSPSNEMFNIISNTDDSDNWNLYLSSMEANTIYINGVLKSDMSEISAAYGGYVPSNETTNENGFIILLDKNMIPFKLITEYKSGTTLAPIHKLKIDEDNNIYGITGQYYNAGSARYFAMFNNFLIQQNNDYVVDLRKSYSINDTNFCCIDIFKSPNSGTYIFFGGNIRTNNYPRAIKLKINVGSDNEWTVYQPYTSSYRVLIACYAEFDSDDILKFKMFISTGDTIILNYFDGTNSSNSTLINLGSNYADIYPNFTIPSFSFDGIDSGYVVFNTIEKSGESYHIFHLKLYKYDSNGLHEIFDDSFNFTYSSEFRYQSQLTLIRDKDNSVILVLNKYDSESSKVNIYITKLKSDVLSSDSFEKIGDYNFTPSSYADSSILASAAVLTRNYNLLGLMVFNGKIYISEGASFHNRKLKILSALNGNSTFEYIDENSFIPKSVELYNDRDLIFARNVYNVDVQKNTTTSSVEIPNTYLNDEIITDSNLVSETYLPLIDEQQDITKNIYESVHINFINSLSILDEKDVNNKVLNLDASIRLNELINTNNSYDKAKITKAKINYTNNTSKIIPINFKDTSDETIKEVSMIIYTDKLINSIDLVSNDEQIIYQKIAVSNLKIDKFYKIVQKVRIV